MKDEKGLIHQGGIEESGEVFSTQHRQSPYLNYVFCSDCEQRIFGKLDNFGVKLILKDKSLPSVSSTEVHVLATPNSEYEKRIRRFINNEIHLWYLFLISLLFRANFSATNFFRSCNLGSFVEPIRKALLGSQTRNCPLYVRALYCETLNEPQVHMILPILFQAMENRNGSGAIYIHGILFLFCSVDQPDFMDNTPESAVKHFDFLNIDIETMNQRIRNSYGVDFRDISEQYVRTHPKPGEAMN